MSDEISEYDSESECGEIDIDSNLNAINLIRTYHSMKYILNKVCGISLEPYSIPPVLRSVAYSVALARTDLFEKTISFPTAIVTMMSGIMYYEREKLLDASVQEMDPVIKHSVHYASMFTGKLPVYYYMLSDPHTFSFGMKVFANDVIDSCVKTYVQSYFNFDSNNQATLINAFGVLTGGAAAYAFFDSNIGTFSQLPLAIQNFASVHFLFSVGMNIISDLMGDFSSEKSLIEY